MSHKSVMKTKKSSSSAPMRKMMEVENFKLGVWERQEQDKYIEFLISSRLKLQSLKLRRSETIFKKMADFIGTRNGIQCRSHHMKQVKRHKKVKKIVENYQKTQVMSPPRSSETETPSQPKSIQLPKRLEAEKLKQVKIEEEEINEKEQNMPMPHQSPIIHKPFPYYEDSSPLSWLQNQGSQDSCLYFWVPFCYSGNYFYCASAQTNY